MVSTTAFLAILSLTVAQQCSLNPATYSFKLGEINGTVISDGPLIFDSNPFSVPVQAVRRSYRLNFRDSTFPIRWAQNVVVLDMPGRRVMVDAGAFNLPQVANFREGGQLFSNLQAAGIARESVDAVLLSHAHGDHIAGILSRDGSAAFPNAIVYIGREENDFWAANPPPNRNPNVSNETIANVAQIYLDTIAPYQESERLRFVEKTGSPIPGVVYIPTPGHSPGHSAIEVISRGKRLVITADAWGTMPDQVQNPEWGFFIDDSQVEAYRSRVRLLSTLAKRKDLVLAYHEEFPGLGFIKDIGPFFDWVPLSPQRLGDNVKRIC